MSFGNTSASTPIWFAMIVVVVFEYQGRERQSMNVLDDLGSRRGKLGATYSFVWLVGMAAFPCFILAAV
jgi:hypothetical protein